MARKEKSTPSKNPETTKVDDLAKAASKPTAEPVTSWLKVPEEATLPLEVQQL